MVLCFIFQSFCLIFFEILQIRVGQHENKKNIFSHAGDLYAAVTGVSQ